MWPSEALLTAVYQAARSDCVTEQRMAQLTGFNAAKVTNCCSKLRQHELLVKTAQGCHKLTPAGHAFVEQGLTLRTGGKGQKQTGRYYRRDTLRGDAWFAMRILRRFSVADLVARVARGGEKAIEENLRDYCRVLARGGYLRRLRTTDTDGRSRFLLIDDMDTGPKPIVWRQGSNSLYDHNTEREIPLATREPQ